MKRSHLRSPRFLQSHTMPTFLFWRPGRREKYLDGKAENLHRHIFCARLDMETAKGENVPTQCQQTFHFLWAAACEAGSSAWTPASTSSRDQSSVLHPSAVTFGLKLQRDATCIDTSWLLLPHQLVSVGIIGTFLNRRLIRLMRQLSESKNYSNARLEGLHQETGRRHFWSARWKQAPEKVPAILIFEVSRTPRRKDLDADKEKRC